MPEWVALCQSRDVVDGQLAVPFDVFYNGQSCRAFAVRFEGQVQAYLNRCSHVAMEMDFQPDRFFDASGKWLVCATHGATYAPARASGRRRVARSSTGSKLGPGRTRLFR